MSEIKDAIDSIVKNQIAPLLRTNKFKGSGRSYHLATPDGTVRVLNVQGSMSNMGAVGKFTISLGIFYPEFARYLGRKLRHAVPAEPECTIRRGIGELAPGTRFGWWNISPDVPISETEVSVSLAMKDYALPWLLQEWNLQSLRDDRMFQRPLFQAVVEFMSGNSKLALSLLQQVYDEDKIGRGNIVAIAERMDLRLEKAVRPSHNSR